MDFGNLISMYADNSSAVPFEHFLSSASSFQFFTENGASFKNMLKLLHDQLNRSKKCNLNSLLLLQLVVRQSPNVVLVENGLAWMDYLIKIIKVNVKRNISSLARDIVYDIIALVSQNSELSRKFASSQLANLIPALLATNENACVSSLKCLQLCMKNFRGPCRQLKIEIEQYLFGLFDSSDEEISKHVAKCFIMLPGLGGGGEKGVLYSKAWFEFSSRLFGSMRSIVAEFFRKLNTFVELHGFKASMVLELPEINEPIPTVRIHKLYRRFRTLGFCMIDMFKTSFPAQVEISVNFILAFVCQVLTTTPAQFAELNDHKPMLEDTLVSSMLPLILKTGLDVLYAFIESCHDSITNLNPIVSKLLLHILDWTKNAKPGCQAPFSELRVQVYKLLRLWATCSGAATELDKSFPIIFAHVEVDAGFIVTNKTHVAATKENISKRKNKKRKLSHDIIKVVNDGKLKTNDEVNDDLCISALQALSALIHSVGSKLKPLHHSRAFTFLVQIGNKLKREVSMPYHNGTCRSELYGALLAAVVASGNEFIPSLSIALYTFERGMHDDNLTVKSTCAHAMNVCLGLRHSQAISLSFPKPPASSDVENDGYDSDESQPTNCKDSNTLTAQQNIFQSVLLNNSASIPRLPVNSSASLVEPRPSTSTPVGGNHDFQKRAESSAKRPYSDDSCEEIAVESESDEETGDRDVAELPTNCRDDSVSVESIDVELGNETMAEPECSKDSVEEIEVIKDAVTSKANATPPGAAESKKLTNDQELLDMLQTFVSSVADET